MGFAGAADFFVVGAAESLADGVGAGVLRTLRCVAAGAGLGLRFGFGFADPSNLLAKLFSLLAAADSATPCSGGDNLTG